MTSVTSGMAPLSLYGANSTATNATLNSCIFPGSGPASPVFSGQLVRRVAYSAIHSTLAWWDPARTNVLTKSKL